ncbi:hypothetical protein MSG28_002272 [Choristoneura fumiferana]|uniref:Uncharacterized protein n=1 Tax=Choristoneura fumiferana TaxID=7141 RepID=A0ACC0JVD8_CHOFU|nr:hypothetical protein MSG28_002272 [Choristoneura fumiferana]
MDLQTSHLAAALMSGSNAYTNNTLPEPLTKSGPEDKNDKLIENQKETEDEKEDIGSGEEFTDEESETQAGSKSTPGRGVTLQMLLAEKMLEPGNAAMTIEYLMEIEKLGLTLLGWYHSHPTNPAMPSLRDCDNQLEYQIKMRGPSEISYIPCIGVICSPYNPESPVLESSLTCFWVMSPPEQRPTEYPRPLLLQYSMIHDSHLSTHAMEQIKNSIKYYFTYPDDTCVDFKESFKPDITYLDKLKCTLTPKFPREQSDGLLWHFIRDELGCSSEHDDKMDLDALLAVPQPIPVSKPNQSTSIPNFPSVSTLQQMVSRPAGVPPINVSSSLGSGSPHKFETPPLNIPLMPTSSKSSKSNTPSLQSSYPTGLDMLTSMALGLGTSNMPLPMGASSLESLAAANSLLTGLSPGMSSSLAASLASGKLPDPPSYAASLHNLTSSIGSYDKTPTSTSTSTTSAAPIPASIASNLMMSSADIANALFSASKYSSAGILGIPDPMSKSTLAANNMFLSPSLMKMQESLMKPLSSSSPISTRVGLDQSPLMKSPHDLIKGSKDYLPPDFGSIGKGKSDIPLDQMKLSEKSTSSKVETSKSDNLDPQATDFSMPSRVGGESFLNQMLELTKKTTMTDYLDYSQPLKLSKSDELSAPAPSQSYSNPGSIVDTITQVAMGNYAGHDEPLDYGKEQDYSTTQSDGHVFRPQSPRTAQETKGWNLFQEIPVKTESGSMASSEWIDVSVKFLKLLAYIMVFAVVLGAAVVAKGTLLFITSQLQKDRQITHCNKALALDQQFITVLPLEERIAWLWAILIVFGAPEIGIFLRSVRICFFKTAKKPSRTQFLVALFVDTVQTIGIAILLLLILPELDVVKGAMLMNALCVVPGLLNAVTRDRNDPRYIIKLVLDVLAISAQVTAFFVWPLLDGTPVLWMTSAAAVMISLGWWENYVNADLNTSYYVGREMAWIWLLWLVSQAWITFHAWMPRCERLAATDKLFAKPWYSGPLIDQCLLMNRTKDNENELQFDDLKDSDDSTVMSFEKPAAHLIHPSDNVTRIYICATMWHETKDEMMEFLKSIFRLDAHQCEQRLAQKYFNIVSPDYYELEAHIFMDDAFEVSDHSNEDSQVNRFVRCLVETIDEAASEVHTANIKLRSPKKFPAPYGGRLVWTLPGKNKLICHLKDKTKIRHRKRWSQVMYMYYFLGHRLMDLQIPLERKEVIAENTYLLALDGDIDFQPSAVTLLIDLMKKDKNLGAACGRIHPVGSGFMAWYQMFEYAIGHWLQKATEHMIGCVLCSPGCFSLFRGKALMDDNVMKKYTLTSHEARHYVQYDQGEDRWLCTLLLQRGYRVEYSAASDAYTHCPEQFGEFYNQRRRWVPSTMANIFDLLADSKRTVQMMLMVGTVLGPGTIFLMMIGAMNAITGMSMGNALLLNLIPVVIFITVCLTCKSEIQEIEQENKEAEEAKKKMDTQTVRKMFGSSDETSGTMEMSVAGLFKCMCCTNPKDHKEDLHLLQIAHSLEKLEKRLDSLGAHTEAPEPAPPRRRSSLRLRETLSLLPEYAESDLSTDIPKEERDDLINPYWIEDPDVKKGEVDFLTTAEIQFWKDLIDTYLRPIDEDREEQITINRDYLMLEPIGSLFLIFFGSVMLVQFTGMLFHRMGTLTHLLSTVKLDWYLTKSPNELTQHAMVENRAFKFISEVQQLNTDEMEGRGVDNTHVSRRKTIFNLERRRTAKQNVVNLETNFEKRLSTVIQNPDMLARLPSLGSTTAARRLTLRALQTRRDSVVAERRRSQSQLQLARDSQAMPRQDLGRPSTSGAYVNQSYEPAFDSDEDSPRPPRRSTVRFREMYNN